MTQKKNYHKKSLIGTGIKKRTFDVDFESSGKLRRSFDKKGINIKLNEFC
jgi:hypothetical protein